MFGAAPFVSLDNGQTGKRAIARLRESRELALIALASFVISLVILFTRFFSDPGAISGIGTVFGDWTKLVANAAGSISTQYFILAVLLYEVLAVVFAIKVVFGSLNQGAGRLFDWSYPAVWFLTALVLFSFSSGRQPTQAVLVAFPILLLGGFGLGDTIETFTRSANRGNRLGLLAVITFGLAIALISVLVLIGRVDTAPDRQDAVVQVLAASIIALGPLVVLAYALGEQLGKDHGWPKVRAAVLIGVGALLSILFLRGTIELAFYRIRCRNRIARPEHVGDRSARYHRADRQSLARCERNRAFACQPGWWQGTLHRARSHRPMALPLVFPRLSESADRRTRSGNEPGCANGDCSGCDGYV